MKKRQISGINSSACLFFFPLAVNKSIKWACRSKRTQIEVRFEYVVPSAKYLCISCKQVSRYSKIKGRDWSGTVAEITLRKLNWLMSFEFATLRSSRLTLPRCPASTCVWLTIHLAEILTDLERLDPYLILGAPLVFVPHWSSRRRPMIWIVIRWWEFLFYLSTHRWVSKAV